MWVGNASGFRRLAGQNRDSYLLEAGGKTNWNRPASGAGRRAYKVIIITEVRRRFIEAAVLEQGYRGADVAVFLSCHASNVSRALQRACKSDYANNASLDMVSSPSREGATLLRF